MNPCPISIGTWGRTKPTAAQATSRPIARQDYPRNPGAEKR